MSNLNTIVKKYKWDQQEGFIPTGSVTICPSQVSHFKSLEKGFVMVVFLNKDAIPLITDQKGRESIVKTINKCF